MIKIIGDGGHAKVCRFIEHASGYGKDGELIAIGDNADRKRNVQNNKKYTSLVDPSAVISGVVMIGEGTVIMENVVIQTGVTIGKHCIINAGAVVTHDCIIGDYAHIAPGVNLCGGVTVGEGALMGVNSCAVPGAVIPPWTTIKAGEVAK